MLPSTFMTFWNKNYATMKTMDSEDHSAWSKNFLVCGKQKKPWGMNRGK